MYFYLSGSIVLAAECVHIVTLNGLAVKQTEKSSVLVRTDTQGFSSGIRKRKREIVPSKVIENLKLWSLTSSSSSSSTSSIPESSSDRGLPPDQSTSVPDPASLRNLHPLPARCCRVTALLRELLTWAWKNKHKHASNCKYLRQI